ncbi:MAG: cation:dicarboxylase symporter family transporter, partial [Lachnospiraceae bacterium]|nr:cation:dicarboxylase symporter family transporter [Lachnospiraceae bacterium]
MRKIAKFKLSGEIGKASQFVQDSLEECGIKKKEALKGTLLAEEAIGSLAAHAADDAVLELTVRKTLTNVTIEMTALGTEYPLLENMSSASISTDDDVGRDMQDVIRNILLRSIAEDVKYRHKDGYNSIRMVLIKNKRAFLYMTLLSLLAAIVAGIALTTLAPEAFCLGLDEYVLTPLKTIYINILKMVVAPVVFFSIVSCIGGFSNLRELGKIGGKTFTLYLITTIVSVSVGIGVFYLLKPGEVSSAAAAVEASSEQSASAALSIKDLFVNMVPSNFIKPFLNDDMPQLIILAV